MNTPRRTFLALHPAPVCAALMLAFNDHLLKAVGWPSPTIAGKVSDFAGLFLFPIVGCTLSMVVLGGCRRWLPAVWAGATALIFALLKLSPEFNQTVETLWGHNVVDPTDLVALPSVLLAYVWMIRHQTPAPTSHGSSWRSALRTSALMAVVGVCAATSPPRYVRNFPHWEVQGAQRIDRGCAEVMAWVSKTGKTGFGLSVKARAISIDGCRVSVPRANLDLGQRMLRAEYPPVELNLEYCQTGHLYVPFAFDNESAWNQGLHEGRVEVTVAMNGVPHSWHMVARQILEGPHGQGFLGHNEEVDWQQSCREPRLERAR